MNRYLFLYTTLFLIFLSSCSSPEDILLEAARTGDTSKIEEILKQDLDINVKDSEGMTALHILSEKGRPQLIKALLDKGADPNSRNRTGETPLFLACRNGNPDLAALLLSAGADSRAKDEDGREPLHVAAQFGNNDLIRILIANGADPGAKDNSGRPPSSFAAQYGFDSSADYLIKSLADIQSAETALLNDDYFAAANRYMNAGVIDKATKYYIAALDTADFAVRKKCLVALGKIGSPDALEALRQLFPRTDANSRQIISFVLKRYGPEKISIIMLNAGEAGRRAIDGYLASVGIITELSQIVRAGTDPDLYKIIDRVLGQSNYRLEKLRIQPIKSSSVPPEYTLDVDQIKEIYNEKKFDIFITSYSSWNEHTKYIKNDWDKPPLEMDIEYTYSIAIPSLDESRTFSYKFDHREPSQFGMDAEQKLARRNTASLWAAKELQVIKKIEDYLNSLL